MNSVFFYRLLTTVFFSLLSFTLFAQRPIDDLVAKYQAHPKTGMEIFVMTEETKDEMVTIMSRFDASPSLLSADYYRNLMDYKVIGCTGTEAKMLYDEVVDFFDTKDGYTTSRSRIGNMRSKGYTLISKDKDGNTVKETNTVMFALPDENDTDQQPNAVVMTIVTKED
ncbi:MAG: hypothetical protein LBV72_02260 [Tannerella sp.]|jgi:hypothetical protein|nr:hypothetical protein [Tannerella sp.]